MKKFLTICAIVGTVSFNANAQNWGGLFKFLTGGNQSETTTTTTATTETVTSTASDVLGGVLGAKAGNGTTSANEAGNLPLCWPRPCLPAMLSWLPAACPWFPCAVRAR